MPSQFHPEFDADVGRAPITQRAVRFGALAAPALASHARTGEGARLAGWIGRFKAG